MRAWDGCDHGAEGAWNVGDTSADQAAMGRRSEDCRSHLQLQSYVLAVQDQLVVRVDGRSNLSHVPQDTTPSMLDIGS